MTAPVSTTLPYLTGSGLIRTLNSTPLDQGPVVNELRRRRNQASGFNPWSRLCGGIRQDLRFRTGNARLAAAVRQPPTGFDDHYRALADGWWRFLTAMGDPAAMSEVRVRTTLDVRRGLTINLNPQVGLVRSDGRIEVIHLWFEANPLTVHAAQGLLYLMQTNMSTLYSVDATACVLDLRNAQPHRLPPRWRHARGLDSYVNDHAARVVSLWRGAAAAA